METHDDDQLLSRLRALGNRLDPAPDRVLEGARAAFTWRTVDAELASLAYDSFEQDLALAGVRGREGNRFLSFEGASLTVEVEVVEVGARRRLVGQLVPPASGRIEVRQPERVTQVDVDEVGRFQADDLESGPTSMRCHATRDDVTLVVDTDWHVI